MKQLLASVSLLFSMLLIGCADGDQGPADASETPTVSEEDVQKQIDSSMSPEMKKKYGK